jgi:hypothetical protein
MSFIEQLRVGRERMQQEHTKRPARKPAAAVPWHRTITRFRGRQTPAGEEWITAREVFDALGIPEPARASLARKVATLLRAEGWRAAMVGPRHLRQRGYVRNVQVCPSPKQEASARES